MEVHVPGLVWAAATFACAIAVRLLPDRPPPQTIVDQYLHIPSTFPVRLSNRGLHRPMTGAASGMSKEMQPYAVAGVRPPRRSMRTFSRKLTWLGVAFVLMAVLSPITV